MAIQLNKKLKDVVEKKEELEFIGVDGTETKFILTLNENNLSKRYEVIQLFRNIEKNVDEKDIELQRKVLQDNYLAILDSILEFVDKPHDFLSFIERLDTEVFETEDGTKTSEQEIVLMEVMGKFAGLLMA